MSDYNKRIRELHKELNNIAVKWALGKKIDFEYARKVRQEAILPVSYTHLTLPTTPYV